MWDESGTIKKPDELMSAAYDHRLASPLRKIFRREPGWAKRFIRLMSSSSTNIFRPWAYYRHIARGNIYAGFGVRAHLSRRRIGSRSRRENCGESEGISAFADVVWRLRPLGEAISPSAGARVCFGGAERELAYANKVARQLVRSHHSSRALLQFCSAPDRA